MRMDMSVGTWLHCEQVRVFASDQLEGIEIRLSEDGCSAIIRLFKMLGDISSLQASKRSWVFERQEKQYSSTSWKIVWTALAHLQKVPVSVDCLHPTLNKIVLQVIRWIDPIRSVKSRDVWLTIIDLCSNRTSSLYCNKDCLMPLASPAQDSYSNQVAVYLPNNFKQEDLNLRITYTEGSVSVEAANAKDRIGGPWEIHWRTAAFLQDKTAITEVDSSLLMLDLYNVIRQLLKWLRTPDSSPTESPRCIGLEVRDLRANKSLPLVFQDLSLDKLAGQVLSCS